MKVLYVFRSLAVWGGIERILVDKMNHLVDMYDYDVYMLTSDQGNHPVPYQLHEKVHIHDLNIRFHQKYQYSLIKRYWVARHLKRLYELRLTEQIKQIKPDIIVCTTADHIDLLVKLKGSTPLVVESHSICLRTIEQGKSLITRKWYRHHYLRVLSKADVVVALTEGDAAEWRKVHPHVEVIPNMVHLSPGTVSKLDNKRVIFVGRFDNQKRPMEMFRIWKLVYPKHSDWCLDIYGEGEQSKKLNEISSLLHMNITIHQPTEHIFDCYSESDLLVSTSLFEPFGLVIPEAMSCGLPVVSFDCPYGPADIITDSVDGFLIKNRNINEFANRVCLLIENEGLRIKMGKAGIKSSQRYYADRIMPLWIKLFNQIVDNSD